MIARSGHHQFGPQNGRLLLHTGRQGVAGSLGHDLTLEVTSWSADVDVGPGLSTSAVSARIDLASLTVLDGHGGAMPLRTGDRREIEANARTALDVRRFPEGVFESTTISESAPIGESQPRILVEGLLTLHGRSEPQQWELDQTAPGRYVGHGVVTQTRFGIKPYTAMFGALKVRDDVTVELEVSLEA